MSPNRITPLPAPTNLAHVQFLGIVALLNRCATLCGMDMFLKAYRPGIRASVCQLIIAVYAVLTVYTLYYSRHDYAMLIQSFSINGLCAAGVQKLCIALQRYGEFQQLMAESAQLYASETDAGGVPLSASRRARRQRLLCEHAAETRRLSIAIVWSSVCGVVLFSLWPAYAFLWLGRYELAMCLLCPGVDHRTLRGYLSITAFQLTCTVYGVTGNLTFDVFVQVVVCSHRSMVDLLQDELNELDEMWRTAGEPSGSEQRRRHRKCLRDILRAFQTADA